LARQSQRPRARVRNPSTNAALSMSSPPQRRILFSPFSVFFWTQHEDDQRRILALSCHLQPHPPPICTPFTQPFDSGPSPPRPPGEQRRLSIGSARITSYHFWPRHAPSNATPRTLSNTPSTCKAWRPVWRLCLGDTRVILVWCPDCTRAGIL
jgi:hypothetical protein